MSAAIRAAAKYLEIAQLAREISEAPPHVQLRIAADALEHATSISHARIAHAIIARVSTELGAAIAVRDARERTR